MSPEIIAAVVGPVAVGIMGYITNRLSAHRGANRVRDTIERQFEERVGQPNGMGPVISMLGHMIREEEVTRDRLDKHVQHDEAIVTEMRNLLNGRTERFDRLDAAIGDVRERQDAPPPQ